MVQDSDGAAIASTPTNAAPNQELDLELEFGDEIGGSDLLEMRSGLSDILPEIPTLP
jgi:hypothetical protein